MASPFTSTSAPPAPAAGATAPMPETGGARAERSLGRRPSLPGGRALVGAALVVIAAVLTYAAYVTATAKPLRDYVVATRDLRVHERVRASDFRTVKGDLPPSVGDQTFTDPSQLEGAVLLAPLDPDSIVTRSGVLPRDQGANVPDSYELSFTVPVWQLGGRMLAPNELIDLVPMGDGRDPNRPATPPVRDVRVLRSSANTGGGLGSGSNEAVITVAARDTTAYQAIVNVVRDDFRLVRSTRMAGAGDASSAAPTGPSSGPSTTAASPTWPPSSSESQPQSPPPSRSQASSTTTTRRS